eukprot:CAMPEP_0174290418 /NCGR_PEP_ID=MMETSP0809-20121228/28765_1 /TAXON_ID=73025 ORGANISM="Eutreptiella gymnastica-like, Strain CCMP1594" /NCGR_SAMPLE_ID=MMETSP0809 /ASSEMBLY_ACC=CAM_ASM_000658 /LENGTH=39 /DNA_ID= /DNA_START= /DNA_END= /DNA_ORIENTATION=
MKLMFFWKRAGARTNVGLTKLPLSDAKHQDAELIVCDLP